MLSSIKASSTDEWVASQKEKGWGAGRKDTSAN